MVVEKHPNIKRTKNTPMGELLCFGEGRNGEIMVFLEIGKVSLQSESLPMDLGQTLCRTMGY